MIFARTPARIRMIQPNTVRAIDEYAARAMMNGIPMTSVTSAGIRNTERIIRNINRQIRIVKSWLPVKFIVALCRIAPMILLSLKNTISHPSRTAQPKI